jgi:cysteine-S-conjugate beta-lyase
MSHPYDALRPDGLRRRISMKWSTYDPDVLPMWVAEMDFPLAEPIRRVLHELVDRGDTGYPTGGSYVEALARFAARRYGWTPDPALAAAVPDVMTGVEYAIDRLTDPGDGVAFLTPAYPPFFVSVASTRRAVVAVPMTGGAEAGWTVDGDALDAALRAGAKAVLLCNPHNPTGRVFGPGELGIVAELADRHGVPVISDEIHAPLILDRRTPHVPFPTLNADCVCLHSASKGWNLPGLKAAILVAGSRAIHDRLAGPALTELSERTGIFGVAAGAAAFDEGETWLADTVDYIAVNHGLVAELLPKALPGARVTEAQATYLAWLDLRGTGLAGEPADVLLDKARVALVRGPNFGSPYRGFARMNVGTSRPIVQAALDRIAGLA